MILLSILYLCNIPRSHDNHMILQNVTTQILQLNKDGLRISEKTRREHTKGIHQIY